MTRGGRGSGRNVTMVLLSGFDSLGSDRACSPHFFAMYFIWCYFLSLWASSAVSPELRTTRVGGRQVIRRPG